MPVIGQRVAYVRVSTEEQNSARQIEGLAADKIFEDKVSGKGTNRPQLEAMLAFVREGDTVLCHSMDRLARNLGDLRSLVQQLTKAGVKVAFVKEGMTFTGEDSPMSMLMLNMMGAFAEFERALILERQREGIAIAKRAGAYKGRKPSLTPAQAQQLCSRVDDGEKKSDLAREFQISRETLYAYYRASRSPENLQEPGGGEAAENRPPKQKLPKPDRTSTVTVPLSEAYPDRPPKQWVLRPSRTSTEHVPASATNPDRPPKQRLPKPDRTSTETVRRTPAAPPPEPPTNPTDKA